MARPKRYRGMPPRLLRADEIGTWIDISDKRDGRPPKLVDNRARQDYLRAKNPVRWYRMKRDFKWAQRQLLKVGVDPEEVRWLL